MSRASAALVVLVLGGAGAAPVHAQTCTFKDPVPAACGDLGCVVSASVSLPQRGDPGTCGPCTQHAQCDAECDLVTQRCRGRAPSPAPELVWPTFHLITVDVAMSVADQDGTQWKPIVGVGYTFEGAFSTTEPRQRSDQTWETAEVPRWYFRAGGALAFGGPGQNLFLELGPSYYWADGLLAISSIAATVLYQRQGQDIWELTDGTENFDRLGPSLALTFLYNLTVGSAVLLPLGDSAANDSTGVLVFLRYDRDVVSDLIPDRFRKYLSPDLQ